MSLNTFQQLPDQTGHSFSAEQKKTSLSEAKNMKQLCLLFGGVGTLLALLLVEDFVSGV